MEIGDLYPYWARERDAMFAGLGTIVEKLRVLNINEVTNAQLLSGAQFGRVRGSCRPAWYASV